MASVSPPPRRRRFLAEPVEMTTRSLKSSSDSTSEASSSPANDSDSATSSSTGMWQPTRKRFAPEPVETSSRSSRKVAIDNDREEEDSEKRVKMLPTDSKGGVSPVRLDIVNNHELPHSPTYTQHKPRRKFAPEPMETSSRSSKLSGVKMDDELDKHGASESTRGLTTNGSIIRQPDQAAEIPVTARRKFAVQPVETNVGSNQDKKNKDETQGLTRARKFAIEPVETTARSSKDLGHSDTTGYGLTIQHVESTTRSSKENKQDGPSAKPKRKFAPQMVETSVVSNRDRKDSMDDSPPDSRRSSTSSRRFAPELVETAKGSFRKRPPHSPSATPNDSHNGSNAEEDKEEEETGPDLGESRFSAANIAKRSKKDPRRHTYCIPDLPVIPSDSSGEESARSSTTSPDRSNMFHQHERHKRPHPKIQPESPTAHDVPDSFYPTQYQIDDRTLRDQAIAAYISAEAHIPFNHYGGDSDDEEERQSPAGRFTTDSTSRPSMFRRSSYADLPLAQADMRLHRIEFERAKAEYEEDTAGASRFSSAAIAARHKLGVQHPEGATLHHRTHLTATSPTVSSPTKTPATSLDGGLTPNVDAEYQRAREAARPPMLGEELKFPFTVSPRMTRCDVDQPPRPRRANSDDSSSSMDEDVGERKLWSAHVSVHQSAGAGLWGGLCQASKTPTTSHPTTPLRSGLQTPAYEHDNPFGTHSPPHHRTTASQAGTGGLWGLTTTLSHTGSKTPAGARTPGRKQPPQPFMPLTPPRSGRDGTTDAFTASLEQKLALETLIEDEFPPRVITQIYNYLSLGYPPLARPFDAELSKISRISISDLRKSDRSGSGHVKGYIGTPEKETDEDDHDIVDIDPDTGTVRGCRRWEALRLYVKEWARQSPNFASERAFCEDGEKRRDVGAGQWGGGAGVRKGSWGH